MVDVAVIDYGMGNAGSMQNMIRRTNASVVVTADERTIRDASAIVLPGVGSFDNGANKLRTLGLFELLNQRVLCEGVPFLGVCLGMQLLFESSEEGRLSGFGWIKGEVKRFGIPAGERLKVPHMGWNLVAPANYDSLFCGLEQEARFYFVHSYHAVCADEADILGRTAHGYEFVSAVRRRNIYGVQFHPEKSHRFGRALLSNFLETLAC